MFDPRIRSLAKFEPHDYATVERALPKGRFSEEMYQNVKNQYAKLESVAIERIGYEVDGLNITGVFAHPNEINNGKHPLLIFNRGGNAHYGIITLPLVMRFFANFAKQGYLVLGSNYRGNDGGDGADEFGGSDIRDVLALIDIGKNHPGWDGKNIFMLGGSRGGLMTYLAIKHGAELNAAVSFAGPSDLWQAVKERPEMGEVFKARIPNHDAARDALFAERSAVKWPEQLKRVPLLLLHGTADTAVDIGHSIALDKKLSEVGATHKFVIYENGDHALSTHRPQMWAEINSWFDNYKR